MKTLALLIELIRDVCSLRAVGVSFYLPETYKIADDILIRPISPSGATWEEVAQQ